MRAAGRRRPNDSLAPDRRPPPPTPTATLSTPGEPWQFMSTGRDSDASFASSRPSNSSIGLNPRSSTVPTTEKSYQASAIRTINAYLASHTLPFCLKPPLPSAKDITETLKFILSRLGFSGQKLDEDLQIVLKSLNCPVKLNKSALRAPGTPHSWPNLLAVIHWLVQISMYNDHLMSVSQNRPSFEHNDMFQYTMSSYLYFIRGDDESVDALDEEYMKKLTSGREEMAEIIKDLERNVKELEERLEGLKTGPTERETLEKEKNTLEEDVKKFHSIIEQLDGLIVALQKVLEEKERELQTKVTETNRVKEENEELKKRIEEQGINARDAERMKKELMAVERDIVETELSRNGWEEKAWDLDSEIGHKLKELEELLIECNQAIKRLKLGNEYLYQLNAKGSTPGEVLGMDYKSRLKPALASFEESIKRASMEKLEELISLRQQSAESASKIESKRIYIASLNSHIDEVEAQLNHIRKETQEYTSRCATEARQVVEAVDVEERNLANVEREAAEFLKASKAKLNEVTAQTEEEVQLCARELFALIDSVSMYKEYMASKINHMKNDLLEAAGTIAGIHRGSFQGHIDLADGNH